MKIKQLGVVSILTSFLGYLFAHSYAIGLCHADSVTNVYDVSCSILLKRIGDPLFYGAGALAIVFLALLYFKKAVPAWKKFAVWFVPLATLLFIFYPEPGAGDLFSPYPESVFKWVSGFYILISAIIVSYSVRTKR